MQKKLTGNLLLFGNPEIDADVRYATSFYAPDPLVYLKLGNREFLLTSIMEAERARKEAKESIDILTPSDLGVGKKSRDVFTLCIHKLLQKFHIKKIRVLANCPVGLVEQLKNRDVKIEVLKNSPFLLRRAIKSDKEIYYIRRVQKVAVLTLEHIVTIIRKSTVAADGLLIYSGKPLTSEFLRAEALKLQASYGCISKKIIIACGKESANPHWIGSGKLYANEPIILDIFPQDEYFGYWGDLTRTIVKGAAPALLRLMYDAVYAAQQKVLSCITDGVNAKSLHQIACEVLKRHNFKTMLINGKMQGFIHSTGHGVGLDIHEYPTIGNMDVKLQAGNVITIEPGLYYHRIGGVRIEDTVLVTKNGYKLFCKAPYYFEV